MSNESVSIEYIVARYFIKYERLSQIIYYAYEGSKAKRINLYIDLYGLYKTLFSRSYRTNTSNYTVLTSMIFNMCVHYRTFFKTLGVYADIYLVSSYNIPEVNCKLVAGYNKTFKEKIMNGTVLDIVNVNLELLRTLADYLPNIYFIHTAHESTAVIDHLIKTRSNNNPNIILSSDLYPLQLVAKYPNTTFLKPMKFRGVDNSLIVVPNDHENFNNSFWGLVCSAHRDGLENSKKDITINPINYPLLMALNRFPERNVKNLINITAAERIIYKVAGSDPIKVQLETLYDNSNELAAKVPRSILESRFKALNSDYQALLFEESIESKTLEFKNLNDPDTIMVINDTIFKDDPIDIYRL